MIRSARLTTTAVLSLGLFAAAATWAADAKPAFESLDKNGDGKLSLTEASAHDSLFVAFKTLDKNKDGELTREEFAAYK